MRVGETVQLPHAAVHCPEPECDWWVEGAGGLDIDAAVRDELAKHRRSRHVSPLRLNLGAGEDRRDGFVSVDLRAEVADVVAPLDDLPYGDETVDELLALDCLEHNLATEVPAVLAEWHRVLKPGGFLTLRVPNLLALATQLVSAVDVERTIENIYGGHRWGPRGSLDCHHTGWLPSGLARDLERAGFAVLSNDFRANMQLVCERT